MNENKEERSIEDCEQKFKNMVFSVFKERIPEAEIDQNGYLVIPASAVERIRKDRRANPPIINTLI